MRTITIDFELYERLLGATSALATTLRAAVPNAIASERVVVELMADEVQKIVADALQNAAVGYRPKTFLERIEEAKAARAKQ